MPRLHPAPRLSILIPALGIAEELERTLLSVLENRPEDAEVVVVDAFGYDDPYDLGSAEVRLIHSDLAVSAKPRLGLSHSTTIQPSTTQDCQTPQQRQPSKQCHLDSSLAFPDSGASPGRLDWDGGGCWVRSRDFVDLVNLGWASCAGEVVHVLLSGATVWSGWAEHALGRFADPSVATVAPRALCQGSGTQSAAAGLVLGTSGVLQGVGQLEKAMHSGECTSEVGCSLAAGFFRRAVFSARPFERRLGPTYAAADLMLSLQEAGWSAVFEPSAVVELPEGDFTQVTSAISAEGSRSSRELYFELCAAERLFWRHRGGTFRGVARLLRHLAAVSLDLGRRVTRPGKLCLGTALLARLCGLREAFRPWPPRLDSPVGGAKPTPCDCFASASDLGSEDSIPAAQRRLRFDHPAEVDRAEPESNDPPKSNEVVPRGPRESHTAS